MRKKLATVLISVFAVTPGLIAAQAQSNPPQSDQDQSIKQDAKDAGHATKNAGKKTGKDVKNGTSKAAKSTGRGIKKGAHKAAGATEEGADKVKGKTE